MAALPKLERVYQTLSNARNRCSDPEMITALTEGMDELSGAMGELAKEATVDDEPKPLRPIPSIFLPDELFETAKLLTRVGMGVVS